MGSPSVPEIAEANRDWEITRNWGDPEKTEGSVEDEWQEAERAEWCQAAVIGFRPKELKCGAGEAINDESKDFEEFAREQARRT